MLAALFKKQFLELNVGYFYNRKTGKRRSTGGIIAYVGLFLVLFGSLGVVFFMVGTGVTPLLATPVSWLYFCIMGAIAMMLGIFGSVFNTYAGLYRAKDNELLLSMPVPPWKILLVRLTGVYALGLLYESLVMIPAVIVYWISVPASVARIVCPILLILLLGLVVLVLTCLLGFLVALIAGKLKNKSFATVLVSLLFLAAYYVVYFNMSDAVNAIVRNAVTVGETLRNTAYPVYLFGRAGEGDWIAMGILLAAIAVAVALTWLVMSRTFSRLSARQETTAKKAYREHPVEQKTVESALLRREWKAFTSNATYMLNCALGTLLMPVAAVALVIFRGRIREALALAPLPDGFLPVLLAGMLILLAGTNDLTAPSVSLEGKRMWILRSVPVPPQKIFDAKQRLHLLVTVPPTVLLGVVAGIVLKLDVSAIILATMVGVVYVSFSAALGLWVDLKNPNLSWTNETVPIKQNMGVLLVLLGGMFTAVAFGVGGFFALRVTDVSLILTAMLVILVLAARLLNRWLSTNGVAVLEQLC